jgi:hypothetical protein
VQVRLDGRAGEVLPVLARELGAVP